MQFRDNRRIGKAAADAVDEAERLLSGRLLNPPDLCRRHLPAWTLVAALGHASRDELFGMTAWKRGSDTGRWASTLAFLAGETLEVAEDERALLRIQRTTLIPLELSLLSGRVTSPTTPGDVVSLVTAALNARLRPSA
jgi:hypothetical protein